MKKATLSIGLFTLVMVLTSFTTPETSTSTILDNTTNLPIDGNGGQSAGRTRKHDYTGEVSTTYLTDQIVAIDGNGGQSAGRTRKHD